jgi:hypothetical protein
VFLALRYSSLDLGLVLLPLCLFIIFVRSALSLGDHYGLGLAPSLVYKILSLVALVIALINLVAIVSKELRSYSVLNS